MTSPTITANLPKLRHNAAALCDWLHPLGYSVAAVTKCVSADEAVVRALLDTPVDMLADARLENLARYPKDAGLPRLLLRAAPPQAAAAVAAGCDLSMENELATLHALALAAQANGRPHGVLLMIDAGDLREGLYYDNTAAITRAAAFAVESPWLTLEGLGLNLTCYGSIIPTPATMARFTGVAQMLRETLGVPLPLLSGGTSSAIPLLQSGGMPAAVNHLRFGEAIFCGTEAAYKRPVPGLYTDCFTLTAPLVEIQTKPSYPEGEIGVNAFGERTAYTDRGRRRRGILAVGRQDTDQEGLVPCDPGVQVLGASSDHLIVDLEEAQRHYAVGDELCFTLNYTAILRGYTSPFVARATLE